MSYSLDKSTGDIIIKGFENGIADNPYQGISDIRNINLISVPTEASANFSTVTQTDANSSGTVVSADSGADTVLLAGGTPQQLQAIVFSGGSLPAGIVSGTVYWVFPTGGNNFNLYTDYGGTSLLNITGTGTGTWATINMGAPKYFTHLVTPFVDTYFMVDSLGYVWSNLINVPGQGWRYTGNAITGSNGTAHGNGLVSYVPSDSGSTSIGYVFVFRDFQIDYATITSNTTLTWTYGWKPSTGETAKNNYLKCATTGTLANLIHESMVLPDNKVYYCDANHIGRWYQADPNVGFDPVTTATYVFDQTQVLPFTDTAQCLAPLGNNLLIGGKNNIVYPWDTFSPLPSFPIFVAESNIVKMVTVNTNTFIFAGNRGRIYYTNGSQAQLYKKVPDHISGTIEPYFTWGGATSNKNQLYFGVIATTNAGVAINQYGGVWAVDLDTKAIRLTNKLSYGTYAGYATAIISNFSSAPAGTGLYIGWNSGTSTFGIDTTSSTPYTGGQATIDTDLIPVGTFLQPVNHVRAEFKLTVPLATGETVSLWYRQKFSAAYAQIGSTITSTTNSAGNTYSYAFQSIPFQNSQWIQLQVVLTSTASSPSYVRLTEIRLSNQHG